MYTFVFILTIGLTYAAMTGSPREMTAEEIANDKTLQGAVDFGMESYNQEHNGIYRVAAEKIRSASAQLVAGILYRVEIAVVSTQCKNSLENANKKLEDCAIIGDGNRRYCTFRLLSQPWIIEEPLKVLRRDCTVDY